MKNFPSVDIIIPHHKGYEILSNCINSLLKTNYPHFTIHIVNNGSRNSNIYRIKKKYRQLIIYDAGENLGYAGGVNLGYSRTKSPYVVFLNDDTLHEPSWLKFLVLLAESDSMIGAIQPKILSAQSKKSKKKVFDYAGAAGGRLDKLGYPFAYGRTFYSIETDIGQYDNITSIFWASGAAMFTRRSAIEKSGGPMDETFFSHMEEIDLSWRLQACGYKILACPNSIVYHYGAQTLRAGPQKTYLNHRNNILLLIKNKEKKIILLCCLRILLEVVASCFYLIKGSPRSSFSVIKALVWNISNLRLSLLKRKETLARRKLSDFYIFRNSPFSVFFSQK